MTTVMTQDFTSVQNNTILQMMAQRNGFALIDGPLTQLCDCDVADLSINRHELAEIARIVSLQGNARAYALSCAEAIAATMSGDTKDAVLAYVDAISARDHDAIMSKYSTLTRNYITKKQAPAMWLALTHMLSDTMLNMWVVNFLQNVPDTMLEVVIPAVWDVTEKLLCDIADVKLEDLGIRDMSYEDLMTIAIEHGGVVGSVSISKSMLDPLIKWENDGFTARWVIGYQYDKHTLILGARRDSPAYDFVFAGRVNLLAKYDIREEMAPKLVTAMAGVRSAWRASVLTYLKDRGNMIAEVLTSEHGMPYEDVAELAWKQLGHGNHPSTSFIIAVQILSKLAADDLNGGISL